MERRTMLAVSLALGVGAALVAAALGRLGFAVDDAWVHARYALAAVEGHPLRYFAGEPITTGATSFLWPTLLLPGALAARWLGPEAIVGWALVLAAVSVGLTFFLLARTARAAGVPHPAWVAPALFSLVAPLWFLGAFNGMETGLFGLGLAGAAWVMAGGSPAWLFVTALARPEGAVVAIVVLLGRLLTDRLVGRRTLGVLVLLAAGLVLAGPRLLTGEPAAAWSVKALLAEPHPRVRDTHLLQLPLNAGRIVLFLFTGLQPPAAIGESILAVRGSIAVAFGWAGFLVGGAVLGLLGRRGRAPLLLGIAAALASLVVIRWDTQFYRYLVPSFPLVVLAATVGWFGEGPPRPRLRRTVGAAFAVLALALPLFDPLAYRDTLVRTYRGAVEELRLGPWAAGETVDELLPPDARVAVHDAGAIAVAGRRPVVDLVGLVTPELAGAYRHGEGAIWEAVSALEPERRPTHAAVIPAWMPYLYRTLWFAENVGAGGSVRRNADSQEFEVWALAWNADLRTDAPTRHGRLAGQSSLLVTDHLDIAHLDDERAHAWVQDLSPWRHGRGPLTKVRDLGLYAAPPPAHVIEGGRELRTGGATFRLEARPERNGVLVFRTTAPREAKLVVWVGSWSDTLVVPGDESRFGEPYTLVPPEILEIHRDERGRVPVGVMGAGLTLYHVWLLQAS